MSGAILYDGETAKARPVAVRLVGGRLEISAEDGHVVAEWPLESLVRPAHAAAHAGELRVGLKRSQALLVIADEELIAALLAAAPQLAPPRRTFGGLLLKTSVFSFLSGALFAAVFYGMPLVAGPVVKIIPYSAEERFGADMAEVYSRIPACEGPRAEAGLAALDRLVARLTPPDWDHPIVLRVIRNREVNAFALPGGHLIATEGLLAFVEDGDELAGVLAHELGHVTRRHVMVNLVQQMGVLVLVDSLTGGSAGASGAVVQMAVTYVGLRYTRHLEEEADREGIANLLRADIDPSGIARLFDRLEKKAAEQRAKEAQEAGREPSEQKRPSAIDDLLSTHPYGGDRALIAREAAKGRTDYKPALTADEFKAVKAICPPRNRRPPSPPSEGDGKDENPGYNLPPRAREVEVIRL
ncbi:MAG: M48 family metallopeptidase [Alphaproteobacteria bacterium]|nr:M48 family metallopeptidase [Alphaproteobacteria bacterium]